MADQKKSIDAESEFFAEMVQQGDWDLIDDLLGDTVAMIAAKDKWLPKHPAEDSDDYEIRLNASVLFNGLKRTIEDNTGCIIGRPIIPDKEMDEEIVSWLDNVDLTGRNISQYGMEVLRTMLTYGLTHVLVDMQKLDETISVNERKNRGLRPYLVHVHPRNVFKWATDQIGGRTELVRVHIREKVVVPTEDWKEKRIERIRVFIRQPEAAENGVTFELYEQQEGSWVMTDSGPIAVNRIPLVTLYSLRTGYMLARPPLQTLARLNLLHWKSFSDYQHYCHKTQVPTFTFFGFDPQQSIVIGPNTAIVNSNPDAKAAILETSGKGAEVGLKNLENLENQMRIMGSELRVKRPGGTTATQHILENEEAKSILELAAMELESGLNQAIKIMVEMIGRDPEPMKGVRVSADMGPTFEGDTELVEWGKARERHDLSRRTYLEGLKRRGMLVEDFDIDEEIERIEQEESESAMNRLGLPPAGTSPEEENPPAEEEIEEETEE